MRARTTTVLFLLWSLAAGAAEERTPASPSREEIRTAIVRLEDAEHAIRQAASDALLAWGISDPDRILRELPTEAADAEVLARLDDLRWKISLGVARARALKLAGDDPLLAEAVRNVFDDPKIVTFSLLRLRAGDRMREFAAPLSIFLADRSVMVRSTTIDFIGKCKTDVCAPQLMRLLSSDPDGNVRVAAALVLADLGKPEAIPDILPLLTHPDHSVRMMTGIALERFKDKVTSAQLIPLLSHDDAGIQMSVLGILGIVATKDDAREIIPFLSHGEFGVRRAAMSALMGIGDPAVIPEIMKRLFDADHAIRDGAARFIAQHGDSSLLPTLAGFLDLGAYKGDVDKFAAKAMAGIAGEDWHYDVDQARAWWERHKSDPPRGKVPD